MFDEPSPFMLALMKLFGFKTVADEVAERLRTNPTDPDLADLRAFIAALTRLRGADPVLLDIAVRAELDACSHRLDAWCTSIATRQLARLRQARPRGLQLGAWAFLEQIVPESTSDSLGYVIAPSLAHAATAGVLRSGYLAHRTTGHDVFDVNLSSRRVQLALELIRGIRSGLALTELLGYRIERGLRDSDRSLFIRPLRTLFPLRRPEAAASVTGAVPPNEVVDAAELLEQWRKGVAARDKIITDLAATAKVSASDPRLGRVRNEIDALDDVYDAVGDLMLAEAVHQTVRGQPERALAASRFLDRQEMPNDPDVAATPRSAIAYVQRCAVALGAPSLSAMWRAVSPPDDPRARAEPRVNAWVAQLLGDPSRWRFIGLATAADGTTVDRTITLSDLKLSPLALIAAATTGTGDQPNELEARIAEALVHTLPATSASTWQLLGDAPGFLGLTMIKSLASAIDRVLRRARAADLQVLGPPDPGPQAPTGIDATDLQTRADAAIAALRGATSALDSLLAGNPTVLTTKRALDKISRAGIPGAVPPAGLLESVTSQPISLEAREFAEDVARLADQRLSLADGLGSGGTEAERARRHGQRIEAIFGGTFPALGLFAVPTGTDLARSLRPTSQSQLTGNDPFAVATWLTRMARVRPDIDALWHLLTTAEALTGGFDATHVAIAQLPHRDGARWAALAFESDDERPRAHAAVVVLTPGRAQLSGRVGAMIVDSWTEQVPVATETGALAIHFDAPSNRAPQAALLAVPPDISAAHPWSTDRLLSCVTEAIELTKLRGLALHDVPAVGAVLPALFLPLDVSGNVPSVNIDSLAQRLSPSELVMGKD
jgi:hypothetical protein